jgi:DNA invertase Pin-like site-specific DNA recombinase
MTGKRHKSREPDIGRDRLIGPDKRQYVRRMLRKGVPKKIIADLLGISSQSVATIEKEMEPAE